MGADFDRVAAAFRVVADRQSDRKGADTETSVVPRSQFGEECAAYKRAVPAYIPWPR